MVDVLSLHTCEEWNTKRWQFQYQLAKLFHAEKQCVILKNSI